LLIFWFNTIEGAQQGDIDWNLTCFLLFILNTYALYSIRMFYNTETKALMDHQIDRIETIIQIYKLENPKNGP